MESTVDLLARAQRGDQRALDDLLGRYVPRLSRWASGRLPPAARSLVDNEDVIQDTLVRAFKHIERFEVRGEGALQAYLRQALANRLTDLYRAHHRLPALEGVASDLPATGPSPLEESIGSEAVERYEAALGRLKAEDREAVIMRIELDCAYDEIAAAMDKPSAAAARMAVGRALARLAREMSDASR